MAKRVAILQPSYIPWRGFFDIICRVDEFILFDDVQFTRRDWRNRNIIKTAHGPQWLTIPVVNRHRYHQLIRDTEVVEPGWAHKHWMAIAHNYRRAPAFAAHAERLEAAYEAAALETRLSRINYLFQSVICALLAIDTPVTWSSDYGGTGTRTDRLVGLCQAAGADRYLSGPSARAYIEPEMFEAAGITLEYMDYSGYPPYPQLHGDFLPSVSALDLILNLGEQARCYLSPDLLS